MCGGGVPLLLPRLCSSDQTSLALSWFDIDLNFVITDAPAARRVLEAHSGLDRVVVPIQTCIQAALTRVEVEQLAAACPGAAACALLHRLQASVAASPPPINELFRGDGCVPTPTPPPAHLHLHLVFIPFNTESGV